MIDTSIKVTHHLKNSNKPAWRNKKNAVLNIALNAIRAVNIFLYLLLPVSIKNLLYEIKSNIIIQIYNIDIVRSPDAIIVGEKDINKLAQNPVKKIKRGKTSLNNEYKLQERRVILTNDSIIRIIKCILPTSGHIHDPNTTYDTGLSDINII